MSSRARWGKTPQKNKNEPTAEAENDDDHHNNNNDNQLSNDDDHHNTNTKDGNHHQPFTIVAGSTKPPPTATEVLDSAIETRKSTISATSRILRDLETAKAVEIEALEMLHKDLDRARRMEHQLLEIDDTMGRSRQLIVALGRKLYRDGCFKIMAALLICAVIVVAVLLAMEGFDKIGGIGGSQTTVVLTPQGDAETTTASP